MKDSVRMPWVFKYSTLQSFFKDFYQLNKTANPALTLQYWEKRVKWPSSLLSEVISGKRKPSLQRVVDFCARLGLEIDEIEYLTCLAAQESPHPALRELSLKLIEAFFNQKAASQRPQKKECPSQTQLLVFGALAKVPDGASARQLREKFIKHRLFVELDTIHRSLNWLLSKSYIKKDSSNGTYRVAARYFCLEGSKQESSILMKNQLSFLSPYSISGEYNLTDEQIESLQGKLKSLENLVHFVAQETNTSHRTPSQALLITLGHTGSSTR